MNCEIEAFERMLAAAADELARAFPHALDNVVLCVEQCPRRGDREAVGLTRGETLLGLYEGVPRTERSYEEPWMFPDRITLFIDPIMCEAEDDRVSVGEMIREVLWHEVAHVLGLDEDGAEAVERRRRKNK